MARKNSKTSKIVAQVETAIVNEAPENAIMHIDTEFDAAAQAALEVEMIAEIEADNHSAVLTDDDLDAIAEAIETEETPVRSCDHLIDESMETAATAGIVDHGSQVGSWVSPELAEEMAGQAVQDPSASEFDALAASYSDEVVTDMVFATAKQIDDRTAFQRAKDPDNTNIQRTLDKVRKQLVTKRAARVMLACGIVDPLFINRQVHDGSSYNVYALGKLADVIFGVSDGLIANAINIACMRSLFACSKADVVFTQEVARAAASDKIHIDPAIRKHLVRHTVSASTAPTQASSTMQALATLGAVTVSGSTRSPVYTLTSNAIVNKLMAKLAA